MDSDADNARIRAFKAAIPFYSKGKKIDLHEQIGNNITERLTMSVIKTPVSQEDAELQLFFWLVHMFVQRIFLESKPIYENMHRLISSSLDCDRLDYVARDLMNSGLHQGTVEYDRLITTMKLLHQVLFTLHELWEELQADQPFESMGELKKALTELRDNGVLVQYGSQYVVRLH